MSLFDEKKLEETFFVTWAYDEDEDSTIRFSRFNDIQHAQYARGINKVTGEEITTDGACGLYYMNKLQEGWNFIINEGNTVISLYNMDFGIDNPIPTFELRWSVECSLTSDVLVITRITPNNDAVPPRPNAGKYTKKTEIHA